MVMAQLQAKVPNPLRHALPGFLSPGRVTAPSIWINLLIFIGKGRLKGATMQVQFDDIGWSECLLWQVGKEELIDDARTRDPNGTLLFARRMRGHHYTIQQAIWPHWYLWTVVETAHHLALGTLLELIGGQVQTCLDEGWSSTLYSLPQVTKANPARSTSTAPIPY